MIRCKDCNTEAKLVRFNTFEYYFCDKCKKEVADDYQASIFDLDWGDSIVDIYGEDD